MVYRPAQVYNGSGWDDIGDKRIGASAGDIPQASVANLTSDLASKAANPKTVDTKTADYTLVLGDKDKIVQMNSTSARTITVPTNASVAFPVGTIVHVANINTGTLTIAGASGVTVNEAGGLTLSQWESGSLYQRAANAWVFLKGGGLGAANFSNAATGTYSSGGFNYKYVTFTASGTLTVTKDGFADVLVIAGGAGAGYSQGGGGGAGGYQEFALNLATGSYTVTIGGGGAGGNSSAREGINGSNSSLVLTCLGGGGGGFRGGDNTSGAGKSGASGGGAGGFGTGSTAAAGSGISGQGNSGGTAATGAGGGGGGAGGSGTNATANTNVAGGSGIASSITGTSVTRAVGGNGSSNASASNGTANTGNGGNGGSFDTNGGNGGSGVVIVRVRT